MGNCALKSTADGRNTTSKDTKSNTKDKLRDTEVKVLVLGTHQSGKTTLCKQLIDSYSSQSHKMSESDAIHLVSAVRNNILSTMATLCEHASKYGQISPNAETAYQYFLKYETDRIDDGIAEHLRVLWADPVIRTTFDNRHQFYIKNPDNISWFFSKLSSIMSPDWVPQEQDDLCVSIRTTSASEINLNINNIPYTFIDLGGLRSERSRWTQRQVGINKLVYVVSLSDYCLKLCENPNTNRLQESIQVFGDLLKLGFLSQTNIHILFTKTDILQELLPICDFGTYQPEYKNSSSSSNTTSGAADVQHIKQWILQQFLSHVPQDRLITYSYTNLLDRGNAKDSITCVVTNTLPYNGNNTTGNNNNNGGNGTTQQGGNTGNSGSSSCEQAYGTAPPQNIAITTTQGEPDA